MNPRRKGIWTAMLGSAAAVSSTLAQPAAIPAETSAAVLLDGGAAWRSHEPTRRILTLLLRAEALRDQNAAWADLAAALAMEQAAAFDAVLGKQAVLAVGDPADGKTPWGLLTSVTPETAKLLESKLEPAPRGFEGGERVVLAERGRFRLNMLVGEGPAGLSRVVLTPASGTGTPDLLRRTAAALEAAPREPGEILAYWRTSRDGEYILSRVSRTPVGVALALRASPEAMGLTQAGITALAKQPAAPAMADDRTLFELAGRLPQGVPALDEQTRVAEGLLKAARVTLPPAEVVGDRLLMRITETDGAVVLTAACELRDLERGSGAMDAMLASLLELASAAGRVKGGATDPAGVRAEIELARHDPRAVRLAVLARNAAESATLAWTYAPGEGGAPAWWVMEYRAGAVPRDQAEAFAREAAGEIAGRAWGRRLLRFTARPARLWSAMGLDRAGEDAQAMAFLKEIDRVDLTLEASAGQDAGPAVIVGTGRVELTPPAPTTRQPSPK